MKRISIFAVLIVASGCATNVNKDALPLSGSKADGSVVLGFSYNPASEIPIVDWEIAQKNAIKRCQAWGYSKASPFEGISTTCQRSDGYGICYESVVEKTFQCTG